MTTITKPPNKMKSVYKSELISSNQFSILQSYTQNSYQLFYQPRFNRKVQSYEIRVQKKRYNEILDICKWRSKTSLPVLKTYYYKTISELEHFVDLQIMNQHFPTKLEELKNLDISVFIYLLKQSLIGFERLFEKFGYFLPSDKMIGINQNNKCKVWYNENFGSFDVQNVLIKENQFIIKLLEIFTPHLELSSQTLELIKELKEVSSIIQALKIVDKFTLVKKLKIPMKFDPKMFSSNVTTINPKKNNPEINMQIPTGSLPITSIKKLNKLEKKNSFTPRNRSPIYSQISVSITPKSYYKSYTPNSPTSQTSSPSSQRKKVSRKTINEFLDQIVVGTNSQMRKTQKPRGYVDYLKLSQKELTQSINFEQFKLDSKEDLSANKSQISFLGQCRQVNESFVEGPDIRADLSDFRLERLQSLGVNTVQSILPDQINL